MFSSQIEIKAPKEEVESYFKALEPEEGFKTERAGYKLKKAKGGLLIEIKAEDWQIAEELTNAFIIFLSEHRDIIPNIFVHSFWHGVVKNIKDKFPEVETFIIMMLGLTPEKMLQLILDAKANGAAIENDYISSELVSLAHKQNVSLNAWLLNDKNSFDKMKKLGVDGLITNYPGRFKI